MKILKVKIADNLYTIERGLMFVDNLKEDEGMLFVFSQARHLNFWGKNTFIPLDIAFIDDQSRIIKIDKIESLSLAMVSSKEKCKYAIEVNEGYFAKEAIRAGDKIEIIPDEIPNWAFIKFAKNNKGNSDNIKKESQVVPPGDPLMPPEVNKPGEQTVGAPIGEQPQMSQLPVLTKKDIGRILEDSFDEAEIGQPEPVPEKIETPEGQETQPAPQEFPVFQTAFEAVSWAEDNNEVTHISYTTKRGRQLERDVEPHGQFHAETTGRQILVTFDESVGDIRAFIVSNIGSWSFVGKKFVKKFMVKG